MLRSFLCRSKDNAFLFLLIQIIQNIFRFFGKMQGIGLNPLFLGTGYNDSVRIPLDYGSDMYEIREVINGSETKE